MNFERISRLGKHIERQWALAGHDAALLPALARDALLEADLEREIDLVELTARALDWEHPIGSSSGSGEAELCVPLFESRDFAIEVQVSSRSSAVISEHAHAGAFYLLHGSSIQSTYEFEETRRVSTHALLGRLAQGPAEVLQAGDARPIEPGPRGLRHCLFHLESPTALLVVRTRRLPGHRAPLLHFPPTIAIATRELDMDRQASRTVRAINMAGALSSELQLDVLAAALPELDVFRRLHAALTVQPDRQLRGRYLEVVCPLFEELAGDVERAVRHDWLIRDALRARARVADPFLRFAFAAAVSTLDGRALRGLLASRFPDGDAFESVVRQMCALIEGEKLSVVWDEGTREEALLRSFLRGDSTGDASRDYAASRGGHLGRDARETVAEAFELMADDEVLSAARPLFARLPRPSSPARLP